MSDKPAERVGRRTFLGRAAMTAGAAGLAPNLVARDPCRDRARSLRRPQRRRARRPAPRQTGLTTRLAQYASALRYEDIPADVKLRIKNTIIDTVAVVLYGGQLPWSQKVIAHAKHTGPGGKSAILGGGGVNGAGAVGGARAWHDGARLRARQSDRSEFGLASGGGDVLVRACGGAGTRA